MPDLGRGWLIVIPIAVVVAICITAWPSEPQEPNHLAIISKSLGSAHVEKVDPPVGPFNIVKPSSRYFKVVVPAIKRTYYVEAYYSNVVNGVGRPSISVSLLARNAFWTIYPD
jgi:hypothetical protein